MIKKIDTLLNNFTMYRVVLYGLIIESFVAIILGFTGLISFSGWSQLLSLGTLILICFFANKSIASLLHAATNTESFFITALIVFFILAPATSMQELFIVVVTGVLAMASKYIFAINKKHVFNPAAIAVFLLGFFGNGQALWWIATPYMLPIVLIVGLLIVRKVRSFSMFFAFAIAASIEIIGIGLFAHRNVVDLIPEVFLSWPLIFFGTVMLTEPLTAPPTQKLQIVFGGLVGLLFGAQFQFGPLYATPEFALLIGNIFTYLKSPQEKLFLSLKEQRKHSSHMYEFVFKKNSPIAFKPGQYMEWTLPHKKTDSRGNRRYFTVASSPTEENIHIGIRMLEKGSSFKHALSLLKKNDQIIATQLAGDFVLPDDTSKKLVFIAGGIGITPFRSMIKYLLDKKERRDIYLLYTNSAPQDFIYQDIFNTAKKLLGLRATYIVTNKNNLPPNWQGKSGRITEHMLQEIPDYQDRLYYLSGPQNMVRSYQELLQHIGIQKTKIITDYFPGF